MLVSEVTAWTRAERSAATCPFCGRVVKFVMRYGVVEILAPCRHFVADGVGADGEGDVKWESKE